MNEWSLLEFKKMNSWNFLNFAKETSKVELIAHCVCYPSSETKWTDSWNSKWINLTVSISERGRTKPKLTCWWQLWNCYRSGLCFLGHTFLGTAWALSWHSEMNKQFQLGCWLLYISGSFWVWPRMFWFSSGFTLIDGQKHDSDTQ